MSFGKLLFSFDGRIGRSQYWIGTFIVAIVAATVGLALKRLLGVPMLGYPGAFRARVIAFVIELLSMYPTTAIAVKRLRDRNRPVAYVWVLLAAEAIGLVEEAVGYYPVFPPKNLIGIVAILDAVVFLPFAIELGFRRGRPMPERHGLDAIHT